MQKKQQSSAPLSQLPPASVIGLSILFVLISIVLWTALISYNPADPAWRHNNSGVVTNSLGGFGAWYSDLSFSLIGKLSYLLPLAFFMFAVHLWREKVLDKELLSWRLFMLLTAILSGCVLWAKHDLNLINTVAQTGGGAVGAWLAIGLQKSIKSIPVIMAFSGIIFAISMSLLLNFPWGRVADWVGRGLLALFGNLFSGFGGAKQPKPVKETAEEVQQNTALQDKIKHLNETAEQRKSKEAVEPIDTVEQTPRPQFTIDRYEPEAPEVEETISAPHFSAEKAKATQPVQAAKPAEPEVEEALKPIKLNKPQNIQPSEEIPLDFGVKKQPQRMSDTPKMTEKSEPSFFDFDRVTPEKPAQQQAAPTPLNRQSTQSTQTAPTQVGDETPVDSLASTFSTKSTDGAVPASLVPNMLFEHRNPNAVEEPVDMSLKTSDREPVVNTPIMDIPAAKPKRTEPAQPAPVKPEPVMEPEVVVEPILAPEPVSPAIQPVVEQVVEPVLTPMVEPVVEEVIEPATPVTAPVEPKPVAQQQPAVKKSYDGIVDETVIQPEAAPVMASPAPKAAVAAAAVATSATIGKAYDSAADAVAVKQPERVYDYQLPSVDLLDEPPVQQNAYTEDVLADMAGVLEQTLTQFNIKATVMHVSPGPVITRFELELAPGIQAKKITNLSQDLARALAVSRVRVEEVIPGSSYVGLEVPNKQRQTVYFHDIVCSRTFRESKSPLTISLGSDTSGKPQVVDLMKMPHALVAGTTGSGKSVCINVMLLSMLYKASPKDLRLILVDPKMLEMSMYEDIPHLLTPVITDMNEAENALTWAVGEMERRYQLMAALKVRKIDAFNAHVDEAIARGEPIKDPLWEPDEQVGYTHHPTLERLPFVVIVIDELADMMMVVGKQVEQLIARLTQKARAAGIHVVLATQRPSTDVLTGLIKANVPTRIAFQVSSGTDSRVIIDGVGAEKLLGHGDMLYVPPGASHPQRLHGAFVGDAETDRITDYLRSTGEPQYIDGVTGKQDPETLGAYGAAEAAETKEDADPLYEEAVQIVLETGKASISSVQRHLRIGYNRAARMIEDMQEQGIVSEPMNGVRKVLGRK